MKKFRLRNWLILLALAIGYILLSINDIDGYWSGFLAGSAIAILIGELIWIIRGREMKNYPLGNE